MKLSAEQFADLAASFPGFAQEDDQKQERRRAARLDLRADVDVSFVSDGVLKRPIKVIVNNFSPRGLGLLVTAPLRPGEQFVTELQRTSGGRLSFLCTIVHSRQVESNLYQVGAEFTCILRPDAPAAGRDAIADQLKRIRSSMLD